MSFAWNEVVQQAESRLVECMTFKKTSLIKLILLRNLAKRTWIEAHEILESTEAAAIQSGLLVLIHRAKVVKPFGMLPFKLQVW